MRFLKKILLIQFLVLCLNECIDSAHLNKLRRTYLKNESLSIQSRKKSAILEGVSKPKFTLEKGRPNKNGLKSKKNNDTIPDDQKTDKSSLNEKIPLKCGREGRLQGAAGFDPDTYSTWPDGIVYYEFSNIYSYEERNVILSGMKMIEDKTRMNGKDCIKFIERTNEQNYVYIKDGGGCSSSVGMFKEGRQELTLKRKGCIYDHIVAHEFIHALGFDHEQNRPDRDKYVKVFLKNVDESNWHNFDIVSYFIDLRTPYDYKSIMHYDSSGFSKYENKYSMIALIGDKEITKKKTLSEIDIQEIRSLYQCTDGETKSTSILYENQELGLGDKLVSQNEIYTAAVQNDGNFFVYNEVGRVLFSTFTGGLSDSPVTLKMKNDGNLVLYVNNYKPLWSSDTYLSNPYLEMQDDGNLVLYDRKGNPYWASRKSVKWNEEEKNSWAFGCDFGGQDLTSVETIGENCSSYCKNTDGCTHYVWNPKTKLCWLKKGSMRANDLINTDSLTVCGFLHS